MDEEAYNESIRSTTPIDVQSPADIEREFAKMGPVIADERNADWELRVCERDTFLIFMFIGFAFCSYFYVYYESHFSSICSYILRLFRLRI